MLQRMRPYIFSFRIGGVVVRAEPSWLFLALLVGWSLASGFFPGLRDDFSLPAYTAMAVAGVAGLTFSIIAHELSHTFVGRAFGLPINHVTLFLFGGAAELESEPETPMSELVMALAGPLMSLVLAGLFALAAGGMLVSLTLLHIAPEAFELSAHTPVFLMVGFFGGLGLHFGIGALFPESSDRGQAGAITPLAAVAIHSLLDGMIYSVTFAASFSSGVYAAASLMLHEFPEGVITFAILRRHSFSNRESFIWAFIASAVTTPLGVIVATPFMYGLTPDIIGSLFAVSAGLLLYVATGPLMEPLEEEPPMRSLLALSTGVGLAILMALMPLHHHDEEGGHPAPTPHEIPH